MFDDRPKYLFYSSTIAMYISICCTIIEIYTEKNATLKFQQINLYTNIIKAQQIYLLNLVDWLSITAFDNNIC